MLPIFQILKQVGGWRRVLYLKMEKPFACHVLWIAL
jgi:hypothetical protein